MNKKKNIIFIISMSVLLSLLFAAYVFADTYSHDSRFHGMDIHKGVDVSVHNGVIDWKAAKEDGVEFAIIRIGYRYSVDGRIHADDQFEANYKGARENDIKVGIYFFSLAKTMDEVRQEAEYTAKVLNGRHLDLPVYYDLEKYKKRNTFLYDGKHRDLLADFANEFCGYIYKKGYNTGVYSCTSHLTSDINMSSVDQKYYVWCAQYNTRCKYTGDYHIWQYSSKGKVDGMGKYTDMNYIYGKMSGMGNRIITGLTKVKNVKRKDRTKSTYTITWKKQSKATKYKVYRAAKYDGTFILIGETKKNYFKDKNKVAGREYYYRVAAVNKKGRGELSSIHKGLVTPKYDKIGYMEDDKSIREGAGLNYQEIYEVPMGKDVIILGHSYDINNIKWYKVRYSAAGKTYRGYMMHPYVKVTKKGSTTCKLQLRKKAGTKYASYGTIPKGKRLTIQSIKKVNGKYWYKVSYKKNTGWVKGSLIKAWNLKL